jgi:hypothetical protein
MYPYAVYVPEPEVQIIQVVFPSVPVEYVPVTVPE